MSSAFNEVEDINNRIKGIKNCESEHNSLLCIFYEYVWDEKDGQYPGCQGIELILWLRSKKISTYDQHWYLSSKLDCRIATKIKLSDSLKSNEDSVLKVAKLNNDRIIAQLAYSLKKILKILVLSNVNKNYTNDDGQTYLHIFVEEHIKKTKDFSSTEITRIQKLIENLATIKAPFTRSDESGKTPLHILTSCNNEEIVKVIICSLVDVGACDDEGNTILHIIVDNCVNEMAEHKKNYVDIVRILISKNADVNARNRNGISPIHLAAGKFHVEILRLFGDNGADFNQRTECGKTALHFVGKSSLKLKNKSNVVETIQLLIRKGCEIEALDKQGYTPMHFASEFAVIEVIDKLIEFGANLNCRTTETLLSPLYFATKSNRLDIMKKLITNGAEINSEALDSTTPLFMSVMWGTHESVQYLINEGANLNQRDNVAGFTLIHMAANDLGLKHNIDKTYNVLKGSVGTQVEENQQVKKLKMLLDRGGNASDTSYCNITPLQLATISLNCDNVKLLIQYGSEVNYQSDRTALTALHLAVIKSQLEIARILVYNQANVNCKGGLELMTPLHFALAVNIQWKLGKYPADMKTYKDISFLKKFWPLANTNPPLVCHAIVEMLLTNGADLNIKDALGRMPIHYAVLRSKTDVLKKLLDCGSQVNVQDFEGVLPLHIILKNNNLDGLKLLLDFGAELNDQDTFEIIMNSTNEIKSIAIKHLIKIKSVNLPISKIYQPLISAPELTQFHEQCLVDAMNFINYRNETGFSFYKFLLSNEKLQYLLIEDISKLNFEELFPMYAALINGACRNAASRKSILKYAKAAWSKNSSIYLPEVCLENIFDHLSNRFLEVFAESANEDDKIWIDQEEKDVIVGLSIRVV